jgi:acyl CoA:acetate/3-ketoacid CoA transferase beta subunit
MMFASQIDRFGNQNFACIGPHAKPQAQLLGMRGAPGNTISHRTSYWVPNHSPQVFVPKCDVVSGLGYDRAAALGKQSARFHDLRRVISNLGVFDFATPDHRMRLASVHPGVTVEQVVKATGFELGSHPGAETRPTGAELTLIRERIDPEGFANKEVRAEVTEKERPLRDASPPHTAV